MKSKVVAPSWWRWPHVLSCWWGSGLLPRMPGTWGSLAALPFWWGCHALPLDWQVFVVVSFWGVAIGASEVTAKALGGVDHPRIVIDEVAGMALPVLCLPMTVLWQLAAFLCFRAFDITKLGPVGWCERHLKGGLGIVADDLMAGLLTVLVLGGVRELLNL